MDESDVVLNSVLEELKNKKLITELEKDIISAIKVYIKKPFNRRDVELKILEIESITGKQNNNNFNLIFHCN